MTERPIWEVCIKVFTLECVHTRRSSVCTAKHTVAIWSQWKLNLVEKFYAFCTGCPEHQASLVTWQGSLYPGQRDMEFKELSYTRWAGKEKALKAVQWNLKAILNLLDDISNSCPLSLAQVTLRCTERQSISCLFSACKSLPHSSSHCSGISFSAGKSLWSLHCLQGNWRCASHTASEKLEKVFGCVSEKTVSAFHYLL